MRKITIKCDKCGFEKTVDYAGGEELKGWAAIVVHGSYEEDAEICPECVKSFIDVKEVKDDD